MKTVRKIFGTLFALAILLITIFCGTATFFMYVQPDGEGGLMPLLICLAGILFLVTRRVIKTIVFFAKRKANNAKRLSTQNA